MTNEELTAKVAELRTGLTQATDLAMALAAKLEVTCEILEFKATNQSLELMLDQLHGTSDAQEVVIHALMMADRKSVV